METFDTATAIVPGDDGSFRWTVPDGWQVGRGAWGGLVAGVLIRAIVACETDPGRVLRSISAEFSGPAVVGPHSIDVTLMRRGSGLSTYSALLHGPDGGTVARLNAVLAEPRAAAAGLDASGWDLPAAPSALVADAVPIVPIAPPTGPVFGRHIEARPIRGGPASGAAAETLGWVRLAVAVPHTAASLIGLVDAWWPASMAAFDSPHPIATVNFSANLVVDPATVPADEPLLHHGTASGVHEGFVSERRRLWTADGRLVVENLQSIVIIA